MDNYMFVNCCPICDSLNVKARFVKDGIPYMVCINCHFSFSYSPRNANFQSTLEEYETGYLQYLNSDPSDAKNFGALRRWMENHVCLEGSRILDIGCGSGKWVRFLHGLGMDSSGIEPSETLYRHFLSGETFFRKAAIDDPQLSLTGPFDIITAFDVLEHVQAPLVFLQHVTALLKDEGWLFVSLPDAGSRLSRLLGKHWHHFNRYHFSFFDASSLSRTAKSIGLVTRGISWYGRHRSLGYLFRYGFEFIMRREAPAMIRSLDRIYFTLNLFDTMYCVFQKISSTPEECPEIVPLNTGSE